MCEDTVSIIVTVLNGEKWVDNCFRSILRQCTAVQSVHMQQQQQQSKQMHKWVDGNELLLLPVTSAGDETEEVECKRKFQIEVCVFDDCSTDGTQAMLRVWQRKCRRQRIRMFIVRNESGKPKGVGYGRNRAIEVAHGAYLCFQDIDDEMLPTRIQQQYLLARANKDALIGCKFVRTPPNSTCRFTRWANELDATKLTLQIYTANGPTVIMPTWLCHRQVYQHIPGGFSEHGYGTPEDLIFFYAHLDRGGRVLRVDECLLLYRYHAAATTFSIVAETIWQLRMQHLLTHVLCCEPWRSGFTIWNAGKRGRKFFRDLPQAYKCKVRAFCDVDEKKINKSYNHYDEKAHRFTYLVPIVHFTRARPPLLICMKLDLTNGAFEANLNSLNLCEGHDYVLFT
ncbi:UDP-GlcNAc:betaGal beta-1,3-N-acetylglucosaminyltransferase-like protein 1 [Zeugodacus cucurbitae]|uniref:UDP-GlcNAc:betaGal beta-1,3-N-acetylglucosaminyltransferase-like protein 1 n=1 Tax=Zeugodacus cucurbitae TaxID=28588 RepID=UPI0023D965DB|nr:UDP-GlcNAc:betaGal beta-1,3-N-acetylglucosaminyltransferase-like protein 1 [Zeugodacus cucurbitae]XP_028898667.2 UDP-GlcNAc:betaGal beta-1,3-N-acetylglucosaminyltransferase-like protein 1 [Zeugodacus cucurbitae]XP_028898669.2 UDP-GlcNAc:betaGal beta-1,3-N-acetylglucosaminyltransferase-like protein 1 [Zeugodacus cucurbitae]